MKALTPVHLHTAAGHRLPYIKHRPSTLALSYRPTYRLIIIVIVGNCELIKYSQKQETGNCFKTHSLSNFEKLAGPLKWEACLK